MTLNYNETKNLVEGWQRFGRDEELLTEAAKGPKDLGPDTFVGIYMTDGGQIAIQLIKKVGRKATPQGLIRLQQSVNPKALGAHEIELSSLPSGWGPMFYDLAMELATVGIMADRRDVSDDAKGIWQYYQDHRPDVTATQLDDLENTLTPTDDDNANQQSASEDIYYPGSWVDSPLSKMYSVEGTPTLDALRSQRKLLVKKS